MELEPSEALDHVARRVIGAAIEVHRHLGPGFLESTYEEALAYELALRNISARRQVPISVRYKDIVVSESRLDLLVEETLIVELKTVESLLPIHKAQVIAYLRATGQHLGLLLNFNVALLRDGIERVILDPLRSST